MGRSGYTSLLIEEKRYAKMRRGFETHIDTEKKTFTVWASDGIDLMSKSSKKDSLISSKKPFFSKKKNSKKEKNSSS